jgi:hypothetical protein
MPASSSGSGGNELVFLAGAVSGLVEGITIQVRAPSIAQEQETHRSRTTLSAPLAPPPPTPTPSTPQPAAPPPSPHPPPPNRQPLEMLKTRFQIHQGARLRLGPTIREILAEGGVKQLYRGACGGWRRWWRVWGDAEVHKMVLGAWS